MMGSFQPTVLERVREHFEQLYGPDKADQCVDRLRMMVGRYGIHFSSEAGEALWDEHDGVLITYADMVRTPGEPPLKSFRPKLA